MNVTYIHSNCIEDQIRVQFRCRNLADAINRTGSHCANLLDIKSFAQNTPDAQKICGNSDILIIHRYLYGPILNAIQYWKARDKKVIVDFDQAINYLTPNMPGYSFWLEGIPSGDFAIENKDQERPIDPIPLEQFKWGLGMVEAATTSSARLAYDWARFTCVHEIPDYLNTCQYPASNQDYKNEIWIGLGNSTSYASFKNSGLLTAMENICRMRPQVKLILCDPEKTPGLEMDIRPSQTKIYFSHSFEKWVSILLKLDIGLVPLYGDHDLRLGPINLLEFMISKIPWIASEQSTFHELSHFGIWVQNSPEAWENAILNIVDQIDVFRKRAAGEPFLFALGQDVSENIDKVLRTYAFIINQT